MVELRKIDEFRWEIEPRSHMKVPGRIYASDALIRDIVRDRAPEQVANVSCLPGIVGASLAMPDIHWGYGFPIGGVAAFDYDEGIVSPGGVGYDINCGVRLMKTDLGKESVHERIRDIISRLYRTVPSGVGSSGSVKLSKQSERGVLLRGARWAVEEGFGIPDDLEYIEENGCMHGADPSAVSSRALERGKPQLGTLGSGNHFIEIGYIDAVYDTPAAEAMGIVEGTVTVSIHSGSRGLGYQVCDDSIGIMIKAAAKYDIPLPDRQLCCAPIKSDEGQQYLKAMFAAVNYAFANRQIMAHGVRSVFNGIFGENSANVRTVYEVAHNIAKIEEHEHEGRRRTLCVHRKGATRAFPPESPHIPSRYRHVGQPVLVPGDMGTHSFILVGRQTAMYETFGSACHGAGRVMSRKQAVKQARGRSIPDELAEAGVYVVAAGRRTLQEEMPDAYKDVSDVVDAVEGAGLCAPVARLRPMGCLKG